MRSYIARLCSYCGGLIVLINAAGIHARATAVVTPEIDGSTLSVGLGLLAGAVLILRSRRRSK